MIERWKKDQLEAAHKTMGQMKAQLRQLQADRDRQLQAAQRDEKRYGREYVASRAMEIHAEAKVKATKIIKDAKALLANAQPQGVFYSQEYRMWNDRLVPMPAMPEFEHGGMLSSIEKFWLKTTHEQLKLQTELAEDFRRVRLQQELASAPPERFKQLTDMAVETGNFALLGMAKHAAAGRTEPAVKTAVIDAEQRIQLPPEDQQAAGMLKDLEDFHHAIESSAREIMSEGKIQDLAAKVEAVQAREAARNQSAV
jgi:hypothetical protein